MTDDIFADIEESTIANHRKAIRYISSSIQATVTLKSFFKPKKYIKISILNISSRGARISTKYKFPMNTKLVLNFKIKGVDMRRIPAKVVRPYNITDYGIVFDKIQHELVDQIILNETDFSIT